MNRVLVIDDDRSMRRTLMIMLEQIGLDPIGAESGEEGLEKFSHEGFAIVLTDLRMEGMTGIELVTRLRQLDPFIPVVVLTAYGTVQTAVQAMKAGAFDYILKPFDVDAITAVINNALDLHRTALRISTSANRSRDGRRRTDCWGRRPRWPPSSISYRGLLRPEALCCSPGKPAAGRKW